jgi:hypothetical protein
MLLRRLPLFAALFLATSCGDAVGPLSPATVAGMYTLETVRGGGPSKGSLVLLWNGRAQRSVTYPAQGSFGGETVMLAGTFHLPSETTIELALNDNCPGGCTFRLFGTRSDGRVTFSYPGPADGEIVETYRRISR